MPDKEVFPGVVYFCPHIHEDVRGFSSVVWRERELKRAFVEQYISHSRQGTIRGLHSQPRQGKLVRVVSGSVQDVLVNIRSGKNFGKIIWKFLEPMDSVWIPWGYAHGFLALEDSTMEYFYTIPYNESKVFTYAWDSPKFNIPWILPEGELPILSDKDAKGIYVGGVE